MALGPHQGYVTAVCAGSKQPDCANPIATGSSSGELCIWNGAGYQRLAKINVGHPVLAIHWPSPGNIIVTLGQHGGEAWMERITGSSLDTIEKSETLPLRAKKAGPSDVFDDVAALLDNKELCLWVEGWSAPLRYSNSRTATAVAIDPLRRYVAVGEAGGVVRIWWGALDGGPVEHLVPARWQWHSGPVRALAHSGPLLLSAGDEGVLCIRNQEDETTNFIPRFSSGFRHLCVSSDGNLITCSLQDNSIALLETLHGRVRPKYIRGIDHSLSEPLARRKRKVDWSRDKDRKRAKGQPVRLLHSLEGGLVAASFGRRVTFLKGPEEPEPQDTFELHHRGHNSDPRHCWALQQLAFSSSGSCIMTCEGRISPALEDFDPSSAFGCLVKWWRRDAAGEYILDSISNNPHHADVTVGISNPAEETVFFTASRDRHFKIWDHIEAPGAPQTEEGQTKKCWQCVAAGQWRSPMVSGCFSPDGSVVAAGVKGKILLMKAEDGEVTDQLRLEASDTPKQLYSVVSHAFLLLACVEGAKDEIVCWDLYSLEVLTKLDLTTALPGQGSLEMRCSQLEMLVFRSGEATFSTWCLEASAGEAETPKKKRKKEKSERELGRWPTPNLTFVEQVSAKLPEGNIQDMAFHFVESSTEEYEHSLRPSLMCWTSCGLLWNLDLSGAEPQPLRPEEAPEETAASALGKITGGRTTVSKAGPVSPYPLRTTPAQQAGLVPRLLQRILPPQVPSHMLPSPAVLWRDFLSIYAKPVGDDPVSAPLEVDDYSSQFASEISQLPPSAPAPPPAELVDEEWMDSLVEAM